MRAALAAGALALLGCYDEPLPPEALAPEAVLDLDESLLGQAWTLKMDSAEVRGLYDTSPGWVALFKQEAGTALVSFAKADEQRDTMEPEEAKRTQRGLARSHLILAAVLRQGALAAAHAYVRSFREGPRKETDPVEVDYLLGVGHGMLGDCSASLSSLETLLARPEESEVHAQAGAWKAWAETDCPGSSGPAGTADFAGSPGPVTPGLRPSLTSAQYRFALQGEGEGSSMKVSDPSSLLILADWHVEAARQAAPEGEEHIVDALASLWRLPGRSVRGGGVGSELPLGWTLFGIALAPSDIDFLNEAIDSGVPAIHSWSTQSLMASALKGALSEQGEIGDVWVDELGRQLKAALMRELEVREGAMKEPHGALSDLAPLALFRGGMWVSEAHGKDHLESAGRLGVMLYDLSYEGKPHKQLAQAHSAWAAWKASTGNTHASTFLHRLTSEYPELEVARDALDIMNLRIQANSISEGATQ